MKTYLQKRHQEADGTIFRNDADPLASALGYSHLVGIDCNGESSCDAHRSTSNTGDDRLLELGLYVTEDNSIPPAHPVEVWPDQSVGDGE